MTHESDCNIDSHGASSSFIVPADSSFPKCFSNIFDSSLIFTPKFTADFIIDESRALVCATPNLQNFKSYSKMNICIIYIYIELTFAEQVLTLPLLPPQVHEWGRKEERIYHCCCWLMVACFVSPHSQYYDNHNTYNGPNTR